MFERRNPLPIGYRSIRSGFNERSYGSPVPLATITQHHGFHQGRPSKIVDVIKGSACIDQCLDDIDMAEMGRGNQRRPVIDASHVTDIATQSNGQSDHINIVRNRCDRNDVITAVLQQIRICADFDKSPRRFVVRGKNRNMERCAPGCVDRIRIGTLFGKYSDIRSTSGPGSGVEAVIGSDFLL